MITTDSKKAFYNIIKPQFISWEFYSQYIDKEPNFGKLGLIVFLRTYSRFIPELKRREKWCETVLRSVEYNVSLDTVTDHETLCREAEELFDNVFNLNVFPSGRSLWIGGTKITKKHGSAIFNCTYTNLDTVSSFAEIYYWLLIGAGTGFSVEEKHISKLPDFYNRVVIQRTRDKHQDKSEERQESTLLWCSRSPEEAEEFDFNALSLSDSEYSQKVESVVNQLESSYGDKLMMIVGDSKEGWVNAIRVLLILNTINSESPLSLKVIYDYIRPEGQKLMTFGGRASGYKSLQQTLEKVQSCLDERTENNRLSSSQVVDLCNFLAENVVSGGVRRSSQIALGDSDDYEFVNLKKNLWTDEDKAEFRSSRVMSNNSVMLYEKPDKETIASYFEAIRTNGEPGIVAIGNMQRRRPEVEGGNPCMEIGLRSKQCCNLTTLNLFNCVEKDSDNEYFINTSKLTQLLRLIVRAGSRMTLTTQWHPVWDKTQRLDRLLGQSLTGVMDAFELIGKDDDLDWQKDFWNNLRELARGYADQYHDELGINRSASITTIKPEGTLSQLPTVSSGIHRSYSPYFKRRVRFSKTDPLSHALKAMGLNPVPENNQGKDLYSEECNTWVFTFPVATSSNMRQIDESAIKQLERYKVAQDNYIESHNVSVTVSVDEREWDDVVDWVDKNFDCIGGVSFLPKFDPANTTYPLLPYEPCDQKTYQFFNSVFPQINEDELISKITKFENEEEEHDILEEGCQTGACPVR